MKTARVIFTFDCNRRCVGCCNDSMDLMSQAKVIRNVYGLVGYDEILITGGEPFLYPEQLLSFVLKIRAVNPTAKVYLYTATYNPSLHYMIGRFDGIHYTIHAEATQKDVNDFHSFQCYAKIFAKDKSFRLYIDKRCEIPVFVQPNVWARAEIKGWMDNGNCPLPPNETLLIWGLRIKKKLDIVYRLA